MRDRLGRWRYAVAFGAGIGFSLVVLAVAAAIGDAEWSLWIDWAVGLLGIAFAVSLLTGVNLGRQESARNVMGDAGTLVDEDLGLELLIFSLTLFFVAPFVTALLL